MTQLAHLNQHTTRETHSVSLWPSPTEMGFIRGEGNDLRTMLEK